MSEKITTGLNDRPKDASIGQSAGGLPDDSGQPIDISDKEVERVRSKLVGDKPTVGGEAEAETEAHPS